jgi:hypothetical protein
VPDHSAEDEVLAAWCGALSRVRGGAIVIVGHPDRDNPGQGGCDALAEVHGSPVAVEHTTLDQYAGQREDSHRFREVVVPLQEDVAATFPDSWIELFVPTNAVPTGVSWSVLRSDLRDALVDAIRAMPIALAADVIPREVQLRGVPFGAWISRQALDGAEPTCLVGRMRTGDVDAQVREEVVRALRRKAATLSRYRSSHGTVLLLDLDSTHYQHPADQFSAALQEAGVGDTIDDVYLISRRRRKPWVLPVKVGRDVYPDLPDFDAFRRDQYEVTYGRHTTW